jgi:hypothetical protein
MGAGQVLLWICNRRRIVSDQEWHPIPGYPYHEITRDGRVRRTWRTKGHVTELATPVSGWGYREVRLRSPDGARKKWQVHRLVLHTFVGPAPSSRHEGNHLDGDKTNNRVENLEWATRSENMQHAFDTGLNVPSHGETHHKAKLTAPEVREIRRLHRSGVAIRALARRYPVSRVNIRSILRRETWAHV